MPLEFDLNGYEGGNATIVVRIHLDEDNSWHPVNGFGSDAIRKKYNFPIRGSWHVVQAVPLPKGVGLTAIFRGTLVLNVPNLVGVGIFLGEFFPATVGKTGKGTATGGQGGTFPTSEVNWRITLVENFIADDFGTKFRKAVELAKAKFVEKLGPAVLKALMDPIFLGLLVANFVKKPANWFKLLKEIGGKVLALWTIVQLSYRLNSILMDIDSAQTPEQLAAAGDALAEFLADLAAQIPLQALLEGVRRYRDGGKPAPESNERKPPEPREVEPPTSYRSWRDGVRALETKIHDLLRNADPRQPAEFFARMKRAAGLRTQIAWWRLFIIETAHHVEWVRRAGPEVQNMAARVREIVNQKGGTNEGYSAALNWLRQEMAKAGIPFNFKDEQAMDLIRGLDICGEIDWSAHDTETWLTNKFNEMVSQGLKNPFNFREMPGLKKFTEGWTEEQYRLAAEGHDPRPGRASAPLTARTVIEIFGNDLGPKFLDAFGGPGEVFQAVVDANAGYKQHTTSSAADGRQAPAHHQPSQGMKKLDPSGKLAQTVYGPSRWDFTNWPHNALFYRGMLEHGADIAHAMLQLRFYRVFLGKKPYTFAEVAAEFKNDPYVLFGLLIFTKFKLSDVMDPGTVSADTLNKLRMPDLIQEARSIAQSNAAKK